MFIGHDLTCLQTPSKPPCRLKGSVCARGGESLMVVWPDHLDGAPIGRMGDAAIELDRE